MDPVAVTNTTASPPVPGAVLVKKGLFCLYQLLFKMDGWTLERLERSLLLQSEILTQPYNIIPHGRIQTVIKNIKTPKTTIMLQTIYKQRNHYIQKTKNQTGKKTPKKTSNERMITITQTRVETNKNLRKLSSPTRVETISKKNFKILDFSPI